MSAVERFVEVLGAGDSSARLRAAMTVGSEPGLVEALLVRCAVEPDFFVRDMLTWALMRQPVELTVPKVLAELQSGNAQARSQALHTLSKLGVPSTWTAITPELLRDPDDEVARTAWRAAVVLAPFEEREALAAELATQLGRGDRMVQLSLSRALVALDDLIEPYLQPALTHAEPAVRQHARATLMLLRDPDAAFAADVEAAKRMDALGPEKAAQAEAHKEAQAAC
ncbi:HEAT repeat domain-containing protein [Kribbella albertanoniae]|uniref:HEAT repeat domain-containing protein n=1 Tax=Kribbella albertanoniae TaxID=1266829 RepID=UPI001EDF3C7C|nr:HEAT repeat domain-containing protein [Kribbella albertanoniae]